MYLDVRQKYKEQEYLSADNSVNLDYYNIFVQS